MNTRRGFTRTFGQGSPVYTCAACGKKTRDTGDTGGGRDWCSRCFNVMSQANSHNDNDHVGPMHECAECKDYCTSLGITLTPDDSRKYAPGT